MGVFKVLERIVKIYIITYITFTYYITYSSIINNFLNFKNKIITRILYLYTHTDVYFSFCESLVESNLGLSPPPRLSYRQHI